MLKYFDLLAYEPKLLYHKENSISSKSGALMTVISLFSIIALSIYFFINMLDPKQYTINVSLLQNLDITLNFTEYPFMMRIVDGTLKPINETERYVKLIGAYRGKQFNLVSCNADKHFGKYNKLFNFTKTLSTYYCVNQTELPTITDSFSMFFDARKCINGTIFDKYGYKTVGENCVEEKIRDAAISSTYFEFVTLDYYINNDELIPNMPYLNIQTFEVSPTFYKVHKFYRKYIEYFSDEGIDFTSFANYTFAKFERADWTGDFRTDSFGKYGQLKVMMSSNKDLYTRGRYKIQDVAANIGGV